MKLDRLVSIIMILLDTDRISAQQLADRFEVSPRTIYRDIDTINMAGIPVLSTPGVGGGLQIMQRYKADRKVFSPADLSTILMGLTSLSTIIHGDDLANALAKVQNFIPANQAKSIQLTANQIHIDLTPWLGNTTTQPYLKTIQTAIQQNRLLSFEYIDRHANPTTRTAEPYQLILKGAQWYWQAYCCTRQAYRLFRLSRTLNLHMQQETFTPRHYPKPQLDYPPTKKPTQTTIKLRIHTSIMDRLLDLCPYTHFTPDGQEHYLVDFPFIESDYHYQTLLSFADKCECLAPPKIRSELKRRIQATATLYKDQ